MTDMAVGTGHDVAGRLAVLRAARRGGPAGFPERVRELVLVASSSRGGSSMMAETLRACGSLLHLRAEINPFLRLAGLGFADGTTDSDRLDAAHLRSLDAQARRDLGDELGLDAGAAAEEIEDDEQFALDVAWRFAVQWPELTADPLRVADIALTELGRARRGPGWSGGDHHDIVRLQLCLLHALAGRGLRINPWFYDLPKDMLRSTPYPVPSGAPGGLLIEEPPFVLTRPWHRASEQDVRSKPLVVKTPSNAYRFGFLRALFPHARIRVLHITRNPGAAVNGLYDGWRYCGFHAHRMPRPLRIRGYTDRRWWKFDLPPGWRRYTGAPLLRVCAFQWHSAHQAILSDVAHHGLDHMVLRFEDLISGSHSRIAAFQRVTDWLGVPFDPGFRRVVEAGIEPVVATAPPAASRWRARQGEIEAVIGPGIRTMADRLGYGDPGPSWI